MKKVLFLIVLFLGVLSSQASYAINQFYYVTTTEDKEFDSDSGDTSGWHSKCLDETIGCSLRQSLYWALQQNNPVTIYLKARGDYCLTHGAIDIEEVDPAEGEERQELDITIEGSGAGRKKIGGELEGCSSELIDNIFNVENGAKLTLKDIQLQGGANDEGGAIHVSNSNLSLKNVVIKNNRSGSTAPDTGGGGVYIKADGVTSTVTVDGSTIEDNSADYKGGGFYAEALSDGNIVFLVSDSTFSNNQATREGGALFATAGTGGKVAIVVVDSSISSNKTTAEGDSYGGGGISLSALDNTGESYKSSISAIISRSTLNSNTSAESGGGIKISSEKEKNDSVAVSFVNSTLSGNTAENDGGGIYSEVNDVRNTGDVSISLSNSTIVKNTATSGSGGGLKIGELGWVEVFSSIIAENSASSSDTGDCDIYKLVPGSTASFYSKGNNFIYASTCSRRQSFASTDTTDVDPSSVSGDIFSLSSLVDNGGPTKTHALAGSSVENKGSCTTLEVDQRGYYRDVSSCTIGSYEANPSGFCGDGVLQSEQGEECDGTSGCSSSCKETGIIIDPTGGFGGGGFTGFGGTDGDSGSDSGSSDSGSGSETGGGESGSSSSSSGSGGTSSGSGSGSGTSSGGGTSSGSGTSSGGGSSTSGSSTSGSSGSGSDTGGEAEGGTGPEGDLNDEPSSGCSCRLVFDE